MRGVSTRNGIAASAPATSTRTTALAASPHFTTRRMKRMLLRGSPGLDRRQLPGARANGSRERPVLLEALGHRGRAGADPPGRVDHAVEQRADNGHRDEVVGAPPPPLAPPRPGDSE